MSKTTYKVMLDISVVDGSFNAIGDVMDYVRYRLNLRGRNTDSIFLDDIVLISETKDNGQMEMQI